MAKNNSEEDTYSYKGWLVSDKFMKRVIAVWLHNSVAYLILMIIFWLGMTAIEVFNKGNYLG